MKGSSDLTEGHVSVLRSIGYALEEGNQQAVLERIEQLSSTLDPERTEDQLAEVILMALRRRVLGAVGAGGNLYTTDDNAAHMRLFTLLREQVPMIFMTYPIANEILMSYLASQERAVIFEIGIGNGEQVGDLLDMLGTCGEAPKNLVVVGLDLNSVALEEARSRLLRTAERWGIVCDFIAMNRMIEAMDEDDWRSIEAFEGVRVVTATFALHHISRDDERGDKRDQLLRRIGRLCPSAIVLVETDADLNEVALPDRIVNAHRWFLGLFRHLDMLDLRQEDRHALKMDMLAREIDDILGANEETRCERYESATRWRERLERAGFTLAQPSATFDDGLNEAIAIRVVDSYVSLASDQTPLIAILCAEVRGGEASA